MHWVRREEVPIPAEQRLARFLVGYLTTILSLNYHTMNYSAIVDECVQKDISFFINGDEFQRYDIDELAREHKMDCWGEPRNV